MNLRFTMDEPLFDPEAALPGLLPAEEVAELETAWGAVKVDEWCAVGRLLRAYATARRLAGLPPAAPVHIALFGHHRVKGVVERANEGDARAARAVAECQAAAREYQRVRAEKARLRARARGVRT